MIRDYIRTTKNKMFFHIAKECNSEEGYIINAHVIKYMEFDEETLSIWFTDNSEPLIIHECAL